VNRAGILEPLRIRSFALLWTGLSVSLLGDGLYFVAIAWQTYEIDNSPTALSIVGFSWMAPQVAFLLLGGVLADRHSRRALLVVADGVRFVALVPLAALALTDSLELWHLIAAVALYGCGEALFGPAFTSIVPELVPERLLVQANALDQMVRPLAHRLIGPAAGGAIVATAGAGPAFAIDAATFLLSATALLAMSYRRKPPAAPAGRGLAQVAAELRDGLRFARSETWLWATLAAAALALLCFWGPIEVLLPYLVKNDFGGSAGVYGLVLAAGGLGAIVASLAIGQRGMPRRHVLAMYLLWSVGCGGMALLAVATTSWHAAVVYFGMTACTAAGLVIWTTLLQRHVPSELLGRITSLDWFVSVSLVPLSFLLVGPVSGAIGVEATLVGGGLLAGVATAGMLLVPGVRDVERRAPRGVQGPVPAPAPPVGVGSR
jgi:Transmembrane secretion effector